MAGEIYILPVWQPDSPRIARGDTRQLSRTFPCERRFIGAWIAIQMTDIVSEGVASRDFPAWSIVAVARLSGVGYYPFTREPAFHVERSYKREKGQFGPWVWTFTNVTRIDPIAVPTFGETTGKFDDPPYGDQMSWVDNGTGDPWCCCPRQPDLDTLQQIRDAYRKAKVGKQGSRTKGRNSEQRKKPAADPDSGPLFR